MSLEKNKELVVSRYKEDISWCKECLAVDRITLYNKHDRTFNYLPNIGRESHTYLHHIIKNYENLCEYTIFCQGNPIEHDVDFLKKIQEIDSIIEENFANGIYFFSIQDNEPVTGVSHKQHPLGLPIYYFLDLLFGIKLRNNIKIRYNCSAQFVVSKKNILNRPKDFYEFLIKFVSFEKDPIEGYVFERFWHFIFNTNLALSKKYKFFLEKEYLQYVKGE